MDIEFKVELLSPKGPNLESPQTPTFLSSNPTFLKKLYPQKGLLNLIGEAKCLRPTSNYPFAYLKFFNRTLEGKQTKKGCSLFNHARVSSWLVTKAILVMVRLLRVFFIQLFILIDKLFEVDYKSTICFQQSQLHM